MPLPRNGFCGTGTGCNRATRSVLFKLLFTVAIVLFVWYGFRFVGKWFRSSSSGSANVDDKPPQEQIEDLTRCSVCDTFVETRRPIVCDRGNCPMTDTRR